MLCKAAECVTVSVRLLSVQTGTKYSPLSSQNCVKMMQGHVGIFSVFPSGSSSLHFPFAVISRAKPRMFPGRYPSAERNGRHKAHCMNCLKKKF